MFLVQLRRTPRVVQHRFSSIHRFPFTSTTEFKSRCPTLAQAITHCHDLLDLPTKAPTVFLPSDFAFRLRTTVLSRCPSQALCTTLIQEFPTNLSSEERQFNLKTLALFSSLAGWVKSRNFTQAAATLLVVFPSSYSPFETTIQKYLDSIFDSQKDQIIDAMLLATLWVKHTSIDYPFIEDTEAMSLSDAAAVIDRQLGFSTSHPYFKSLTGGLLTKEQFASSQSGFYFAVEGWAQALALLIGKLPDGKRRLPLLNNLFEEHGLVGSVAHTESFRQFLLSLESSPPAQVPLHIAAFNASVTGFCEFHHIHEAGAALGCIEYLYVAISHCIAEQIIKLNWVQPGQQSHYSFHEEIDLRHSMELFQVSESEPNQPRIQAVISLQLAAYYFWNLYLDMLHASATQAPTAKE